MIRKKTYGLLMIAAFLFFSGVVIAQETKKLYDPSLNGMKQIRDAVDKASGKGKFVLIQYGGNWCS